MLPLAPLTAISLTFNTIKHYHSLIDRWSKSFQVNPGVPHVSQPFMQDSLWQCFLAWRAASRPVHPSALHLFALQSGIQSRCVFHRCLEQFVVVKCPEFWGSSKQHPMWSLNILISTRWRTFGSQLRLPRQFREWNRSPTERTVKSQDTVRYCKILYNTWIFNTKYWTRWCIMNSFSLGGTDCDEYDGFCRLSLLGILYLMHMLLYGMKSGITTWTVPTCRSDVFVRQFWTLQGACHPVHWHRFCAETTFL